MTTGRPRTLLAGAVAASLLAGCGATRAGHGTSPGTATHASTATASASAPDGCLSRRTPPLCDSPQAIRTAYGVTGLISRGIDGRGEVVVLPEEATTGDPSRTANIRQDLSAFDARFGLPGARLDVDTRFAPSAGPGSASPEEALDAEMIHTIAPRAVIRVLLFRLPIAAGFATVVRAAAPEGDVISVSYGTGEQCVSAAQASGMNAALEQARLRHVTVVASAGDDGAVARSCGEAPSQQKGVGVPASDPLVLAAGGTQLTTTSATGAYGRETAWNDHPGTRAAPGSSLGATGGGFSRLFARPDYQHATSGSAGRRGVPDVAADADPMTGLARILDHQGHAEIVPAGGTSAAAPLWAGIAALADQAAHRRLGFLNPALYRIADSSHYHQAFHDITAGTNTVTLSAGARVTGYRARSGWDPVTGLGSPDAQVLVPLLARSSRGLG